MSEGSLEKKMKEEMNKFKDDPEYRIQGYSLEISEEVIKRGEELEDKNVVESILPLNINKKTALNELARLAIKLDAEWEFKLIPKERDKDEL